MFLYKILFFSISSVISIPIMLIGINGGYFPAICRVCLKYCYRVFWLSFQAHKLEASAKANSVQNCLSAGSVNPEFGKMPDGRLICPLCSKFFDSMKHARRHVDTIHMKIELKCEICGSSFNRKDNLKSHLMKKHGMESDTSKFLSDKAAQKSF